MKKLILFMLMLLIIGYAMMHVSEKTALENAKKYTGQSTENPTINAGDTGQVHNDSATENPTASPSNIIVESDNYTIEKITPHQLLTINEEILAQSSFSGDTAITIQGTADPEVESISVEFSNMSSHFKNDHYQLKTYTKGAGKFQYLASPEYKVLDTATNTYFFTAQSKEGESITKLTIHIDETEETDIEVESATGSNNNTDMTDINFPKGDFGEAIILDDSTAYFSDIKGLEIKKRNDLSSVVCTVTESSTTSTGSEEKAIDEKITEQSITDFLVGTYNSWVYWNTCRPTIKDKGINFYVLRLIGEDKYSYEKHYIDYNKQIHGVLELQTGTGVTKENISEKNAEFKDQVFTITTISDPLFQQLAQE